MMSTGTAGSGSGNYQGFREEIKAFLDEKLTPELRAAAKRQDGVYADEELTKRWQAVLFEKGWVAPNWPVEHGGPGWDAMQRFLFRDMLDAAGAPRLPGFGLQMCGPVLMRYGTDEQKAFFLPKMLSGEHYWCQGYSEPDAGSDLSSLRTRADRDGDFYVVNGSKTWTSYAHIANWIFVLARTTQGGKPQAGISFFLIPLDTPGITVQPIISITGAHEQNAVFFDNVRVPAGNLIGEENAGWTIAKYLLEWERGGGAAASRIRRMINEAKAFAKTVEGDGCSLWDESADFRARASMIEIELMGVEFTELELATKLTAGDAIGNTTASILKLNVSTLEQRASELNMEALGLYAPVDQRHALGTLATAPPIGPTHAATPTAKYFNLRAATIYGGSYEVQHNILASMIGL